MEKIVLIDGSSILYRAFYALPHFVTKNNEPTGALYGFLRMLLRVLKDEKPQYLAVAFDRKAPTKRHIEYKAYKAQRPPMPDELSVQFETIHELLNALGIKIYEMDGYEADDIIGTIAKASEKKGLETVIISGDMDLAQLISPKIKVKVTRKGVTTIEELNETKLKEKLGISPNQIPDYKALSGDPSDNIPGVPGIGPKTAVSLLSKYGSVENILAHLPEIKKGKLLAQYKDQIIFGKSLCTLMLDVPIHFSIDEMRLKELDKKKAKDILTRFEFNSLLKEFGLESDYVSIKEDDRIGLCIEGDQGKVKRFAIATGKEAKEYNVGGELFTDASAMDILKKTLESDKKKEVFNLKELYKVSRYYGIKLNNIDLDVALAGYLINPGLRSYSAKELCKSFSIPYSDESLASNAKYAIQLSYIEENRLKQEGLSKIYDELEKPLSEVLADMELVGIKIDTTYFKQLKKDIDKDIEELENKIYELAGISFNILSSKQLAAVLFDNLGLAPSKKGKTGYSTSSAALSGLINAHPIVPLILQYRHLSKLRSGYIEALPKLVSKEDFRLHTTFHQLGTSTGRLRSSNPNLQNIPARTIWGEKIRAGFVSSKGHLLLSADYSQIELRVLAHLSKDEKLIEAFRNNMDIHTRTASLVFNVKEKDVTKEMRRRAKILNFGIIYGMSPYGVATQLGCSREEASSYIDRYFAQFPTVRTFLDSLIEKAEKTGETRTIMGRKRKVLGLSSNNRNTREEAKRVAINTPIQGSAADIIKIAMIKLFNKIKNSGNHIILQIHDELVCEVKESDLDEMKETMRKEMESAYPLIVPLKVNIKSGRNLKEAKG